MWEGRHRRLLLVIGLPAVLILMRSSLRAESDQRHHRLLGATAGILLYVPGSYDRARPTPLVISLHALALGLAAQMETSRWNKVADEHGFVVVYPLGTGVVPIWLLRPEADLAANVRFISELIDTLEAAYNIDKTMIYANGFSNGGAMAFALSCRLSHRIAAVGTVAAAQDQRPSSWCADSTPVPFINFHGTADFVPYNGGMAFASQRPFPSVPAWTADWARRNRCGPKASESTVAADVTRLEYTTCAGNAAVVLCTIAGGAIPGWRQADAGVDRRAHTVASTPRV